MATRGHAKSFTGRSNVFPFYIAFNIGSQYSRERLEHYQLSSLQWLYSDDSMDYYIFYIMHYRSQKEGISVRLIT